jgi:hypothetical protein
MRAIILNDLALIYSMRALAISTLNEPLGMGFRMQC